MNNKEFKRHIAYEALVILGVLALLLFICRLWPILLLVILGIFIAALRLLFLSARKVEVIMPLPLPPPSEPTEKDVQDMAYGTIQRRINELVLSEYPDARWVWETPMAKQRITNGEDVFILLNHAGGYRKAKVVVRNLQVCDIEFQTTPENAPVVDHDEAAEEPANVASNGPEQAPNYEYLAFEWVDAHAVELNERCNEAIATGRLSLLIGADELPVRESWPDICRELDRSGIENCIATDSGITINLAQ